MFPINRKSWDLKPQTLYLTTTFLKTVLNIKEQMQSPETNHHWLCEWNKKTDFIVSAKAFYKVYEYLKIQP